MATSVCLVGSTDAEANVCMHACKAGISLQQAILCAVIRGWFYAFLWLSRPSLLPILQSTSISNNSATAPQNLFQFSDDNRSKMVTAIRKDALDAILKAHVAESGSSDTKDKLLGAAFVVVGYGGK